MGLLCLSMAQTGQYFLSCEYIGLLGLVPEMILVKRFINLLVETGPVT